MAYYINFFPLEFELLIERFNINMKQPTEYKHVRTVSAPLQKYQQNEIVLNKENHTIL